MKIVRQRDLKDCGVCSLLSIIRFYNGDVSLEQLRMDAKVTINGTTALNLIMASKKYGFDAYGKKLDNLDSQDIVLPAIAHLNLKNSSGHYVVIYKITDKKVVLMDPAKGKVVMPKKEFYKVWSKIILVFYPKRKIIVLKKNNSLLHIFKNIIVLEKKLFLKIILISIFLIITTVISSYYFQIMIDAINSNYDKSYLIVLILIFLLIMLFKVTFSYVRSDLENHLNKNIDVYLNSDFLNHLFKLPLEVIESRTNGEIVTRVSELTNLKNLVTEIFVSCFLDFFLSLAVLPLLIKISKDLFLVLVLTLLIYLMIGIITSKIVYKKAYQNIEYHSVFNNTLIENVNMINSIKNLNVTDISLKKVENDLSVFLNDSFLLNKFLNLTNNLKDWVNEIGFFIVNTWGFYLFFNNNLSVTQLITFNTLLSLFVNPLKNCIDSLPKYNLLKATYIKLNDFLSVDEEKNGESAELLDNSIEIKNLNYSYNSINNIINNVSFKINSGEFVSFKGPSGCGKSTICKILDRYITDYKGTILIGNENIKDKSITTIRNNIRYVSQNEALFTGTIKENILLGRTISNELFLKIVKLCDVDKIVDKKNMRYESVISDMAENLSGGEKERIILARALVADFKILILDEALSEVDYKLERKIITNLKKYYKDKTIIYITHKNQNDLFDRIINIGGNHELSKST